MWFGSEENASSRGFRGGAKLNLRASERGQRRHRLSPAIWVPLLAVLLAVLGWLVVTKVGGAMLWQNDRYTLRTLAIRCDGQIITARHVREYAGLSEGMNLLSIDLRQVHGDFLRKTPVVKSLTLCRKLPDTLEVDVVERTTLARVGYSPAWGVDREGRVFSVRPTGKELPVITGYPASRLTAGAQLNATAMSAIEVLDACNRTRLGDTIKIASIDVSPKDSLELFLADGARVALAWTGMGTGTGASRKNMEQKLHWLARAAEASAQRGRRLSNLDLTFHEQYMPAQEY